MTPEARRIAIAEACGWTVTGLTESDPLYPHCMFISNHSNKWVSDPTQSLDAMSEAEAAFRGKLLPDMDGNPSLDFDTWYGHFLSAELSGAPWWSATPSQRATAFLKTLGLLK